jgi:hypothetical protein
MVTGGNVHEQTSADVEKLWKGGLVSDIQIYI